MDTGIFWDLRSVSDAQLCSGLSLLLANGYRTEARIIAHMAEVEQRRLHLKAGGASLFDYCTKRLELSNNEAFHRITAARIARRFPVVFTLLEQRELHLTAICLLRDHLTPSNHAELLAEASHKTKWQIQELLARRFPRPDAESRIRKLPQRSAGVGTRSRLLQSFPLQVGPRGRHLLRFRSRRAQLPQLLSSLRRAQLRPSLAQEHEPQQSRRRRLSLRRLRQSQRLRRRCLSVGESSRPRHRGIGFSSMPAQP